MPQPKRIVFVSHRADMTGAPRSVAMLVNNLARAEFCPELVVPETGPLLERLKSDVGVHILGRGRFAHIGLRTVRQLEFGELLAFGLVQLKYIWQMYWLFRRRADIVHINSSEEPFAAFAAFLARKPIVWHIQETLPNRFLINIFCKFVLLVSTQVILASQHTKITFLSIANCKSDKCIVIYSGVNTEHYQIKQDTTALRLNLNIESNVFIILLPGTIVQHKGQAVLVEALALLPAQTRPLLLLAGAIGDVAYADHIKKLIRQRNLDEVVQWLGYRNDIADLLNLADVVVIPSLLDSFPWVVLEAMLAAKPVIATDICGIGEMLVNGQTGLLVPPNDPVALSQALEQLFQEREVRESMGRAGQCRVATRFSEADTVAKFATVYQQCAC